MLRIPHTFASMMANTKKTVQGCSEWQGGITNSGYGKVSRHNKTDLAHRLVWKLAIGVIPRGLQIMHECDNRRCINIAHLSVGTASANSRDMHLKKRGYGSRKTHCKWGHEFTPENTILTKKMVRKCLVCTRIYRKEYYKKFSV